MDEPKLFTLIRNKDESGVSGTGRVLDGVLWHTGQVTICWRTDKRHGHSSLGIYPNWEAFQYIHIDSHPENDTEIIWRDRVIKIKPTNLIMNFVSRDARKYKNWDSQDIDKLALFLDYLDKFGFIDLGNDMKVVRK